MDPEIRELLARHSKAVSDKENAALQSPSGPNGPLSPFATPLLKPQQLKKFGFAKITANIPEEPVADAQKPSPLSDSGMLNDRT
jgi:hypothetical protein